MDLSPWFQNADAIERAIVATGVNPALACAVVAKETGGRHVYGNDSGGVFATPGAPDLAVTKENYAEYLRRVLAGETANGVGIMQITWAGSRRADGTREGGFHTQAIREGLDLSDPYDNCVFGLRLVRDYLNANGGVPTEAAVKAVGKRYNGADAYGDSLWAVYQTWAPRLASQPTTGGTMSPIVTLHGKKACTCQQKTLPYLERDLRAAGLIVKDLSGLITQQAYNSTVNASGPTHDGGGVWDVEHRLVDTDAKKRIWARHGWIPFDRRTIDAPISQWPNHGHMVVAGCDHRDASAMKQEASARAGRNALANNGPFRGDCGPIITWEQALARETGTPGLPSTGADGPAPAPKPTAPTQPRTLKRGSVGDDVKRLQAGLLRVFPAYAKRIRTNGGPNRIFGPATDATVREFQRRSRLTVDGIVGPITRAELAKYGIKP